MDGPCLLYLLADEGRRHTPGTTRKMDRVYDRKLRVVDPPKWAEMI